MVHENIFLKKKIEERFKTTPLPEITFHLDPNQPIEQMLQQAMEQSFQIQNLVENCVNKKDEKNEKNDEDDGLYFCGIYGFYCCCF